MKQRQREREMRQMATIRLKATRQSSDPRGMYMMTVERGEAPALYEHLIEQGFQPREIEVIDVSGSETDLRRLVAEGLGVQMRDVSASVARVTTMQVDEHQMFIDAEVA